MPAQHVLPGLMQMLCFGLSDARRNTVADQHLVTVQGYIRQRLSDADCRRARPRTISGSRRVTCTSWFARDGMTFGKFVLDARLEACRKPHPRLARRTDQRHRVCSRLPKQSHFSRAFRQKFG
jgi:hypothetical protein